MSSHHVTRVLSPGVSLGRQFLRHARWRIAPPRARLAAARLGQVALRCPRCPRRTIDAPDHSLDRWCTTCEPGAPPRFDRRGRARSYFPNAFYVGALPRAGGPIARDDRTRALPIVDRGRRQEPARRVPRGRLGAARRIIRAGGGERGRARVVRHHRHVLFGVPAEEGRLLSATCMPRALRWPCASWAYECERSLLVQVPVVCLWRLILD